MWGRVWSRTSEWKIMNVVVSCVFPRYTFPQCTIDVCLCFRISIKTMTESVIRHLSLMLLFSCILKYPFILSVCCEDVCYIRRVNCKYVCSKCVCILLNGTEWFLSWCVAASGGSLAMKFRYLMMKNGHHCAMTMYYVIMWCWNRRICILLLCNKIKHIDFFLLCSLTMEW